MSDNLTTKTTKTTKTAKTFHNILWSKYFLPTLYFIFIAIGIIQIILYSKEIYSPIHENSAEWNSYWRGWLVLFFSITGSLSAVTGTFFINRRSKKWIYPQMWTMPAMTLAMIFSLLPLQALQWILTIIPLTILYRTWNKDDPQSFKPKKLSSSSILISLIVCVLLTFTLGFLVSSINNWINTDIKYFDAFPYVDSAILVFSIYAPFLIAKSYWAGNYFYFIANFIAIILFIIIGNYVLVLINLVFLFYCFVGTFSWIGLYHGINE
ncbi:MAG: hypothetical protein GQ557_00320 [Mycoplasmataceae bacterium]|nr:hypothetical protein [Mycoplasmataceae bacterium]